MILYHSENKFSLSQQEKTSTWLSNCIKFMKCTEGAINYIFCDDEYLLKMNQEHLNHDTYTDIISFDYSDKNHISGDIFISTDRVKDNAQTFSNSFQEELHRVLIHGLLHFAGYKDKTDNEKLEMRKQENYYLSLHTF